MNPEAAATIKRWADNPRLAVRQIFHATPDPWQDDVLETFSQSNNDPLARRIALQACKNPGKTAVLVWCTIIFLLTRRHSLVPAVSITWPNLRDNYWRELAVWRNRSEIIKNKFEWTQQKFYCKEAPETWYASARTFQKTANPEELRNTLAGTHNDYMMFVLDETGGMPPAILSAADAALGSGIETRLMVAGNCTSRNGILYHACVTNRHMYKIFKVTGDPDDPHRAPRVDIEWAREMIKTYGRDNPWVKADVLSEFPESEINALITPEQIEEAMNRDLEPRDYTWAEKRLFLDVAFEGGDLNVFAPIQGLQWFDPITMAVETTNKDFSNQITAKARWIKANGWNWDWFGADCTGGYGDGVCSNLMSAGEKPFRYNGASAPLNPMFADKVTECWWNAIEAIKHGASLPNCPQLVTEFSMRTYTSINGKIKIEPKKLFKKRLGRSPNFADAYAGNFAIPMRPAKSEIMKAAELTRSLMTRTKKVYDPYAKYNLRPKSRR